MNATDKLRLIKAAGSSPILPGSQFSSVHAGDRLKRIRAAQSLAGMRNDYQAPQQRERHKEWWRDADIQSRPAFPTRPFGDSDKRIPGTDPTNQMAGWPAGSHEPFNPGIISTPVPETLPTKLFGYTIIPGSSGGRQGLSNFYPGSQFGDKFINRYNQQFPDRKLAGGLQSTFNTAMGRAGVGENNWLGSFSMDPLNYIQVPDPKNWKRSNMPILAHELAHQGSGPTSDMGRVGGHPKLQMMKDYWRNFEKLQAENSKRSPLQDIIAGPTLSELMRSGQRAATNNKALEKLTTADPYAEWYDDEYRKMNSWYANNPMSSASSARVEELQAMVNENTAALGMGWDPRKTNVGRSSVGTYDKLKQLAFPDGIPASFKDDPNVMHDEMARIRKNLQDPGNPLGKSYRDYLTSRLPKDFINWKDVVTPLGPRFKPSGDGPLSNKADFGRDMNNLFNLHEGAYSTPNPSEFDREEAKHILDYSLETDDAPKPIYQPRSPSTWKLPD